MLKGNKFNKIAVFLLILIGFSANLKAQSLKKYDFEELNNIKNQKLTLVFIHTKWCQYCSLMEASTFQNKKVIRKLNQDFRFVSLDAESKKDIKYQNHTFKYKQTSYNKGIHDLAYQLGEQKGKLNFPALVVLNSQNEIVFQIQSYLDYKQLLKILTKLV